MPHCFEMGRAYERKHRIDGAILRAYGDQQGKKKIRHDASSIAQPFEATTRENFFVYLGCRGVIHTRSFYLLFMYYSLSLSPCFSICVRALQTRIAIKASQKLFKQLSNRSSIIQSFGTRTAFTIGEPFFLMALRMCSSTSSSWTKSIP